MSEKNSLWFRITRFFRPETETYETRRGHGGAPGADPTSQHYGAVDQRRHGPYDAGG
jgi:hypothetical protein